MLVGWMTLGEGHPLDPASNRVDELANNERALAYADALGVGWLQNCEECETASDVSLSGTVYSTPKSDPAPWYTPLLPDRAGFCGIFVVDVDGAEDSTLTASTVNTLHLGGTSSASYRAPREIVVHALAVADSECALQEGWGWYKIQINRRWHAGEGAVFDPEFCQGQMLTFFECCPPLTCRDDDGRDPCPCDDMVTPGGPCWVQTYAELKSGCGAVWWPSTYAELKAGPPTDDEWCHWVYVYYELKLGADAWTCGAEQCVVPYLYQFYDCVITRGPDILAHRQLSNGAYFEFEMTITAGDPTPYRLKGHPNWAI